MAWFEVRVPEGQITSIIGEFGELRDRTADMTGLLMQITYSILEAVRLQYETEGDYAGYPFKPLSERYAAWKESKVPGLPLLFGVKRTGPLGQRPQSYGPSGEMRRISTDQRGLEVGTNRVLYAPASDTLGWHEFGTDRMPARPPVLWPPSLERKWSATAMRWLDDRIAAALP